LAAKQNTGCCPPVLPAPALRQSGLNVTALTSAQAGEGLADLPAGGHVPQPRRAVPAAGGQGPPVRAERHRSDVPCSVAVPWLLLPHLLADPLSEFLVAPQFVDQGSHDPGSWDYLSEN